MLNRNLKEKTLKYLDMFPCVVLLGARQVGKSTLLKQVLPTAKFYDLENLNDFDYIRLRRENAVFKCIKLETIGTKDDILTFKLINIKSTPQLPED
jgi:predicted AAA+ superfamily ATPase